MSKKIIPVTHFSGLKGLLISKEFSLINYSLPKPQEFEPVRERVSVRSNQSNDGPSFDEFYQNLVFQGELSETMIEQR